MRIHVCKNINVCECVFTLGVDIYKYVYTNTYTATKVYTDVDMKTDK